MLSKLFGDKTNEKWNSWVEAKLQAPTVIETKTEALAVKSEKTSFKHLDLNYNNKNELLSYYNNIEWMKPPLEAFTAAMHWYLILQQQWKVKKSILTVVDYTQSWNNKRMYSIDFRVDPPKVIFNSLVGHGENSGREYANNFWNKSWTHESSLGYYLTPDEITKPNDQSKKWSWLRMVGLENGINDQADERWIFMHEAPVDRSLWCFTIPKSERPDEIENELKWWSILFAYYPEEEYFNKSLLSPTNQTIPHLA
jgi:hypothetical protein